MNADPQFINAAIETLMTSQYSVTPAAATAIAQRYGEPVAEAVREVYAKVLYCPIDWSRAGMDEALGIVGALLTRDYPWLSQAARGQLIHTFIMNYK